MDLQASLQKRKQRSPDSLCQQNRSAIIRPPLISPLLLSFHSLPFVYAPPPSTRSPTTLAFGQHLVTCGLLALGIVSHPSCLRFVPFEPPRPSSVLLSPRPPSCSFLLAPPSADLPTLVPQRLPQAHGFSSFTCLRLSNLHLKFGL